MRFILITFAALLAYGPPALAAKRAAPDNLTVLADPSLTLPMAEIARLYSKTTGTPLTVIMEYGNDPAQRIEQGLEAHVLLSNDPGLVETLAQRGLIDVFGTLSFARTQLALVAPADMKKTLSLAKHISFAAMLFARPNLPVYVTSPTTQAGLRAQELMEGREFSHELSARARVMPELALVKAALRREPGFALMLAPDAVTESDLTILSLLPQTTSKPVRYDAVVLASESMEPARKFTRFLNSEEAKKIFTAYGFQPSEDEIETN